MQWNRLKIYACSRGIRLIGDLPIYVAADSADVWAQPQWFLLDEDHMPKAVAGCPPDDFSETGQFWGNPLYDWDALKADRFAWWCDRMEAACERFDVVRIDHFRGLESYWAIPAGETTAQKGHWEKGPGMDLIRALRSRIPKGEWIAEDLGFLTPAVYALLEESGLPGMKVLLFAFDGEEPSDYLPHRIGRHCVVYTGTHDNTTAAGWLAAANESAFLRAKTYLGLSEEEGRSWGMIRGALASRADLCVVQMQDYLGLGEESRINTPGTSQGNWQFRLQKDMLTKELADRIRTLVRTFER